VEDGFDIEEALVPQERASETKKAKKFLLLILKDGAMPTKEIKSAARDEAISWGTLRRAYDKMRGRGIRSFKEKKAGGKWFWELEEFTRRKALVEANAESRSTKERMDEINEKIKEKDKEGSVEEARPLAPESEPEMSEKEKKEKMEKMIKKAKEESRKRAEEEERKTEEGTKKEGKADKEKIKAIPVKEIGETVKRVNKLLKKK
jgi:hypothetical protein